MKLKNGNEIKDLEIDAGMSLAPVCLFVYKRLDVTRKTVSALQKNDLASSTELLIFSDAPRSVMDANDVNAVRDYLGSISGFKSVQIIASENNRGLADSIIEGVSTVLAEFETAIILEDDLITSSGFLRYMNQALSYYAQETKVLCISGYSYPINFPNSYAYDVAFGLRASSWGWATWRNRWQQVDWQVRDYSRFRLNILKRFQFNRGGSDLSRMIDRQMNGAIDSWAIRWCFHQFKYGMVDVFPIRTLVENIGWGSGASNCDLDTRNYRDDRWIETPSCFRFPSDVAIDLSIVKQFKEFNNYFNRFNRLFKRLRVRMVKWFQR